MVTHGRVNIVAINCSFRPFRLSLHFGGHFYFYYFVFSSPQLFATKKNKKVLFTLGVLGGLAEGGDDGVDTWNSEGHHES